jgi:hypothetical protein
VERRRNAIKAFRRTRNHDTSFSESVVFFIGTGLSMELFREILSELLIRRVSIRELTPRREVDTIGEGSFSLRGDLSTRRRDKSDGLEFPKDWLLKLKRKASLYP